MKQFNDPFDCRFQFKFSGSGYDKTKFISDSLKAQAPHLTRKKRRSRAHKRSKALSDPDVANAERDQTRQDIEKWGICCLSEIRDDILMWAHYANAHRGFCLEFSDDLHIVPNIYQEDTGEITSLPIRPFPIVYSEKYPVANPISFDWGIDTFLTKAKQWEYEKEWRIVFPGGTGSYKFRPHHLTGVIFGCRMPEEHKEMLRKWCRNRQPAITYYEAKQSEDSYSLNIVEIS